MAYLASSVGGGRQVREVGWAHRSEAAGRQSGSQAESGPGTAWLEEAEQQDKKEQGHGSPNILPISSCHTSPHGEEETGDVSRNVQSF